MSTMTGTRPDASPPRPGNESASWRALNRRTIVQPVEMPHLWAAQAMRSASAGHRSHFRYSFQDSATLCQGFDFSSATPDADAATAGTRFSRLWRQGARASLSAVPDEQRVREIHGGMERLRHLLREDAASHGGPGRHREALVVASRLLELLADLRPVKKLRELIDLVEQLRGRLEALIRMEGRRHARGVALERAWQEVSSELSHERRFWDGI